MQSDQPTVMERGRIVMTKNEIQWTQPEWQPIETYPRQDGIWRNGTRVWLWHENYGVVWGFMDDLPSGFRCELHKLYKDGWRNVTFGVRPADAARELRY